MMTLTQFRAVWLAITMVIGYLVLFYNTNFILSKFIADWVALISLSFMSASTAPAAWTAFRNGISSDLDRFIFSYWLIWTIIFCQRVWIILLATMERPDHLVFSPISGVLAVVLFIAAGFGAAAPLSGETPPHKKDVVIFSIAAKFSGLVAGIAIGVYMVAGWKI
jgi:hypothetical protein